MGLAGGKPVLPLDTRVRIITEEFPHGIGLSGKVVGHYLPNDDTPAHLAYNMVQLDGSPTRIGFRTHELEVLGD
jgi:hypothetical protein